MDKPSYNSLKESLKCANDEARGYLDQLAPLRQDNEKLRRDIELYRNGYKQQERIITALLELVELRHGAK